MVVHKGVFGESVSSLLPLCFQMFEGQTLNWQRRNRLSKSTLLDDRFPARCLIGTGNLKNQLQVGSLPLSGADATLPRRRAPGCSYIPVAALSAVSSVAGVSQLTPPPSKAPVAPQSRTPLQQLCWLLAGGGGVVALPPARGVAGSLSTPNMTGRRYHRTTEAIPR